MAGRHRKTRQSQRGRHRKPPQRQRVIIPAMAGVAVLSAGGMAVANAVSGSDTTHHAAPAVSIVGSVTIPSSPSLPMSIGQTTTPQVAAAAHHARRAAPALIISDVHGPCYVEVSHHGKLVTRTILRQGKQLVFRRHGLDLVLGNAGAVRLRINGHHAVRPGQFGQVRNLRVN